MDGEATKRHKDTLGAFGLGHEDLATWRESGLPEEAFVEWLVDRVARRPTGSWARQVYGAEDVHDFARRAILDALALGPADHLLEVGCGGGLLLRDALVTGASVTGLDHSEEMVVLAREQAPGADVVLAKAERLPFADGAFSAIACRLSSSSSKTRSAFRASVVACCDAAAASPSTRPALNCAGHPLPRSRSRAKVTSTETKSSRSSPDVRSCAKSAFATSAADSSSPPAPNPPDAIAERIVSP